MPNALFLNDVIECKFFCNDQVQNGINVIHYMASATVGGGVTDQDVANAMSTSVAPLYKNYLAVGNRYAGLRVQIVNPNLFPAVVSLNGAGAGVNVSDALPPSASFLLSPRTNIAGRAGRGRTYLPFWNEDQSNVGGHPTAGAIALATAWSNGVFATLNVVVGGNSVTLTPIIWSRRAPLARNQVLNVVIRSEWATQRRRSFINKPDVLGP